MNPGRLKRKALLTDFCRTIIKKLNSKKGSIIQVPFEHAAPKTVKSMIACFFPFITMSFWAIRKKVPRKKTPRIESECPPAHNVAPLYIADVPKSREVMAAMCSFLVSFKRNAYNKKTLSR
jgi:hypothetical protein